jgi:hypothetical protein
LSGRSSVQCPHSEEALWIIFIRADAPKIQGRERMDMAAHDGRRFETYQRNITWFRANYEHLRKSHPDEFVAVNKDNVIVSDKTLARLLESLRKEYANDEITTLAIQYVSGAETEPIVL